MKSMFVRPSGIYAILRINSPHSTFAINNAINNAALPVTSSVFCEWKRQFQTSCAKRRSKTPADEDARPFRRKHEPSKSSVVMRSKPSSAGAFKDLLNSIDGTHRPSAGGADFALDKPAARKAAATKLSDFLLSIELPSRQAAEKATSDSPGKPVTVKASDFVERIDHIVKQKQLRTKQSRDSRKAAAYAGVSATAYTAVENVTNALVETDPVETMEIKSDLLRKLRAHEQHTAHLKMEQHLPGINASNRLDELFSDMKFDKSRADSEPGSMQCERMNRTIERAYEGVASVFDGGQHYSGSNQQNEASMMRRKGRGYSDRLPQRRQYMGEPVRLFEGPDLGIFKEPEKLEDRRNVLPTWDQLYQRKLQYHQALSPRNAFEEMQVWTDQGRLWRFPIDNEQDMEVDGDFDEHIFLLPLLDDFPKAGPLREFMEIVVYALSDNPFLTVQEKHEHIDWFRKYFKEKRALIAASLGEEMSAFEELPTAVATETLAEADEAKAASLSG